MEDMVTIAVIGAGQCTIREARLAEEVGRELARRGAALICGGLGGVMEAACRGASEAGGLTIGILPGENRQQANPYIQLAIASGVGRARNMAVVKSARAVIAVSGGYGTLSEIAFALQSGIPVIGLNTWSLVKNGQTDSAIIPAQNAAQAVTLAMELAA
ncbi:MAG: TIGR00725 family protein [Dehalococcoidales bacterium]